MPTQKFTLYTAPVEDIIRAYGVQSMIYADDTQSYSIMESADRPAQLMKVEDCVRGVKTWSVGNRLLHLSSHFLRQLNPIASSQSTWFVGR